AQANNAKRDADRAGGFNRPAYAQATRAMTEASRLRQQPGREPGAVTEYGNAASLFTEAAQPPIVASVPTTTTPPVVTVPTTTVVTTAPTTTPTSVTTSVLPTTAIVVAATISRQAALDVLDRYAHAYRSFNLDAIRQVFPVFAVRDVQRLNAQK